MDLGLESKRVLITGSTQGIGKAIAEGMLEEGANVAISGRNQYHLDSALLELRNRYTAERVLGFAGDISVKKDLQKLSEFIYEKWDGIDILVPCVGRGRAFSADKLDDDEWDGLLDINLKSVVRTIRLFEDMLAENGSIVTISSIASREVINAPIAYAAAKEGLVILTKYLSRKLAKRNIRINCVMPGNIYFPGGRWEEILADNRENTLKYISEAVPLKRFGTPQEIADGVLFLASERSAFTTGSILVIDGGQTSSTR